MTAGQAEDLLRCALGALDEDRWEEALDRLPAPIYIADAEGRVTFWNQACIEFAGRRPELGRDRWCVTWKIWTMEGDRLPHDRCPMAVAIKEKRAVRGDVAIAERPDGSRVAFAPYPTPLFAPDGTFAGAVNMLLDVTSEQRAALETQAGRCRRLSQSTGDKRTMRILSDMADSYDATAATLGDRAAGAGA